MGAVTRAHLDQVRRRYGVPGRRGARITFDGRPGTIVSARMGGLMLGVRFDDAADVVEQVHPTYLVQYDGEPQAG